jgi:hypothetical protein
MLRSEMSLTTTVSQDRHTPMRSSSSRPEASQIGLIIGQQASILLAGPWGLHASYGTEAAWTLGRTHNACEVTRTHANQVRARCNTGVTGHDEGSDIVIRSVTSCTRAPRLRRRNWIVSIVAEAHGVVFHTSRRKVSSNT